MLKNFLKPRQLPILIFTAIYLIGFTFFYIGAENYEFLLYIAVVVLAFIVILSTNNKFNYSNTTLWGLSIWGLLHMAGGGVDINGDVLYRLILIPISETYEIFKFDQFVHMFGFGVATLLMYEVLSPSLTKSSLKKKSVLFVSIMAGVGLGAVNEIVEFLAVVLMEETGVGGYTNTALDLVSNLIGAVLASFIIAFKDKN